MYGISTNIYHRFMANVGKYTSPMDSMGMGMSNHHMGSLTVLVMVHLLSGDALIGKVLASWRTCLSVEYRGLPSLKLT